MNINDYLEQHGNIALARLMGINPVLISQWRTKSRPIPAERCPDIERATGGLVTCEELRPDVNWAVLRGNVGAGETAQERKAA